MNVSNGVNNSGKEKDIEVEDKNIVSDVDSDTLTFFCVHVN